MSRLTGWWDRRSNPARVELYTRWTFPFFALTEVAVIAGPTAESNTAAGVWAAAVCALVVVHSTLSAVLADRGLDWSLGRRPRPTRLFAAVAAVSAGGALTALSLRASGLLDGPATVLPVAGLMGFGLGALALGVRSVRAMLYSVPAAALGVAAACALLGLSGPDAFANGVAVLATGLVAVAANGCSVWLLRTVWELDAARELQSQLAVAEERLRFGRDLHDVMGRNLAVIALKSELAVQLARRGRPEAVEQMIEVQRLAQESQREVRDVVRGYRGADLAVELSGALSVLRAAGVRARSEEEGEGTLPAEVQTALGWVIREATTNVLRHSDARLCTIRLSRGGSAVLTVENDGVPEPTGTGADGTDGPDGFDDAAGPAGSGLIGLRERLAALGGTLAVEARPGTFRLSAEILLDATPALTGRREARTAGAGA